LQRVANFFAGTLGRMPSEHPGALVHDPDLPVVDLLLSHDAVDVVAPVVAPSGGTITQLRPDFIDYSAGRSIRVAYEAWVTYEDRAGTETVVAFADTRREIRGSEIVEAEGSQVGIWRAPDDPYLPGLASAQDAGFVSDLLDELGLGAQKLRIERLSYTPRSRSVIRVSREPVGGPLTYVPGQGFQKPEAEPVLYLKALRRSRAAELRDKHDALADVIPIPRCLAHIEDLGLLAFEPLDGVPLWDCVVDELHRPLDGHELVALLDQFQDFPMGRAGRITTTQGVRLNAATMARIMPSQAARLERFIERLGDDRPQPEVTIHGDFHEVQILLGPDGLSGVLDLDDSGTGQRIDDLAMMLGRLYQYAQNETYARERVLEYTWSLFDAFGGYVSPYELQRRMAGTAMNNALQPFRFQQHDWRAAMAAAIASADALLNELLTQASVGSSA